MKHILTITAILAFQMCHSQELDIFQTDSIYSKNKISVRTMYFVYDTTLQKELVTYYNSAGQKIKQLWYWNGDSNFHNVETFYYLNNGLISSIVDSFAEGNIETATYHYDNIKYRVTVDQHNDTCDYRLYPNKNMTIKRWYREGKPYRYDTTTFEKENIKMEYYGTESSSDPGGFTEWHYKFINNFDLNGNLLKVSLGGTSVNSYTEYTYDNHNLLRKKEQVILNKGKVAMRMEYSFTYK